MIWFVAAALAIEVPAGIYTIGDREVYVDAFEIADTVLPKEGACRESERRLPTVDEWLIAAQRPGFKVSNHFESLREPPEEHCEVKASVLEAEGIEGWLHFGGWGKKVGESAILGGKGDPKSGHIRTHQMIWHFWGEDTRPSPVGERCVKGKPANPEVQFVQKEPITLKSGRKGGDVFTAPTGAQIQVFHRADDWAWVSTEKRVPDDTGSEPRVWSCSVRGWVEATSLASDRETKPFKPGEPLELATWCPGEPSDWKSCVLPWSEGGWIDLDLRGLGPVCGDEKDTPAYRGSAIEPKTLYMKIPAGAPDRDVQMRARTLLGERADGEFNKTGWGPWREVNVRDYDLEAKGGVLTVPMSDVLEKANHKVQIEISVTDLPVYAADLIWPVSC